MIPSVIPPFIGISRWILIKTKARVAEVEAEVTGEKPYGRTRPVVSNDYRMRSPVYVVFVIFPIPVPAFRERVVSVSTKAWRRTFVVLATVVASIPARLWDRIIISIS